MKKLLLLARAGGKLGAYFTTRPSKLVNEKYFIKIINTDSTRFVYVILLMCRTVDFIFKLLFKNQ